MPGFPYIPGIYLFVATTILILGFFERPVESSIAIGTVLLGIPAYLVFAANKNKTEC